MFLLGDSVVINTLCARTHAHLNFNGFYIDVMYNLVNSNFVLRYILHVHKY